MREVFWRNFFGPAIFEPVLDYKVTRSSGMTHNIPVIGIDRSERNIALVLNEPDPIKAKLIGFDIESAGIAENIRGLPPP
jgi:hypothetical protein